MALIVSVAALKGGVGKSTVAVNLSGELALRKSVVLVDADPQASATAWAQPGRLPFDVRAMPLDNEKEVDAWVRRVLGIPADLVIVDCPPRLADATRAAVGLADLVLVPVTASGVDLVAAGSVLELIRNARSRRKDGGPKCLIVPSRIDRRTSSGREIESALKQFGEPVTPAVHQRAVLADAFTAGEWVGQFAPASPAFDDVVALSSAVRRRL